MRTSSRDRQGATSPGPSPLSRTPSAPPALTATSSVGSCASLEVSLRRGGHVGSGTILGDSVRSCVSPAIPRGASQMSLRGHDDGVSPRGPYVLGDVASLNASPLNSTVCPESDGLTRRRQDALHSGPTPIIDAALYLGSAKDANDAAACRAAGITAYLCAAGDLSMPPLPAHAVDLVSGSPQPLLHLPLRDVATAPLAALVPTACAFIEEQLGLGGRVLVYCQAGRSRSVSVVAAYLMRRRGINADAALGDVRARYPRADPNIGFLLQLGELGAADDDGGESGGGLLELPPVPAATAGDGSA